jgi:hypothetical protein
MTATPHLASEATTADAALAATQPLVDAGPFVLNLCSSTTPMALAQTELPELQRFTFFVSRRFEEGRERFRLHMGFFATLAEAEEWLGVVREVYPGAWAGEAPGKKLRARAVEAAATQARHAIGPQPKKVEAVAKPVAAPAPAAVAPAASRPPGRAALLVPTLHPPKAAPARGAASPAAAPARRAAATAAGPAAPPTAAPAAARPPAPGAAAPGRASRTADGGAPTRAIATATVPVAHTTRETAAPASLPARTAARPPAAPSAKAAAPRARPAPAGRQPLFADSNVKEVLAALDGPERAAGRPPADATRRMLAQPPGPPEEDSLSDTQVLRVLEGRREERAPALDSAAASSISLLKPDDTGTRRALREALSHNHPVSFAVQLLWSVRPVALDRVPPLAIFSAYTLYCVEGSREGRKWYGLRLGFFNDAISAKQVAYYVRSEFTSVAVVPVSTDERERATEDSRRIPGVAPVRSRRASEENEIKLIEDSGVRPGGAPAAPAAALAPSSPQTPPASAARTSTGKVVAGERRTPQTLEETLEILGANELAIDRRSEAVEDTGVRHLRVQVQKNTPFSRLLERLSERVRKP